MNEEDCENLAGTYAQLLQDNLQKPQEAIDRQAALRQTLYEKDGTQSMTFTAFVNQLDIDYAQSNHPVVQTGITNPVVPSTCGLNTQDAGT